MNYYITLTNGDYKFEHHFSADEFGIIQTSITMFIVYSLFIVLGIVYAKILHNRQFLHVTFKLFLYSIVIEWLSFLFYMSEYAQFMNSGIHTPGMLITGN